MKTLQELAKIVTVLTVKESNFLKGGSDPGWGDPPPPPPPPK